MTQIPAGRSYRIRNQRSDLYLTVEGYSLNPSARLVQSQLNPVGDGNRMSQVWQVLPFDFGMYMVANKASGLVTNVWGALTTPGANGEQHPLATWDESFDQEWLLRDAGSPDTFEIVNAKSQLVLTPQDFSTAAGTQTVQLARASGDDAASQQWVFEVEDEYPVVLGLPVISGAGIGDIHRMTSYAPTTSGATDPVEVGVLAYPFPLVSDTAYDIQRQGRENPYYIVRHYVFWERISSYEHGGGSATTKEITVQVGLTNTNSTTIEETVSWGFNADRGMETTANSERMNLTISKSMGVSFSKGTTVTTTSETAAGASMAVTLTRAYDAGARVTEAIWYRSDRYVVERMDGSHVLDWTIRDPRTSIADTYSG